MTKQEIERKALMLLIALHAVNEAFPKPMRKDSLNRVQERWVKEDLQHMALQTLQRLDLSIHLPENLDVLSHPLGKRAKQILAVIK